MKNWIFGLLALISLATSAQVSAAVYTVDARVNTVTPSSRVGVSVAPLPWVTYLLSLLTRLICGKPEVREAGQTLMA